MGAPRSEPIPAAALLGLAAVASAVAVVRWSALGDYPNDAGPALAALLHGHGHAFFAARPAMGSLSLFLRAPFAALGYVGHGTPVSVYRWGAVPCVAAVGLLGVWLGRLAAGRGAGRCGQVAIVLAAVLNPMVQGALSAGHPEELLTASLCVGALTAALLGRVSLTTVLLGLALCTKQWAVVAVGPILLSLGRDRLRTLSRAVMIATVVTAPMVIGNPGAFLSNQLQLAHERYLEPAVNSWLWLLAPRVTKHLLVSGQPVSVRVAHLSPAVVGLLHPLIIALAVGLSLAVARRRRGPLSSDAAWALMATIFVLRCVLDTETMPYYHAALLLSLLAWDALSGSRVPVRGLAGLALSFALFDRLGGHVSVTASGLAYGGCSLGVLLWLARALLADRGATPAGRSHRPRTSAMDTHPLTSG